MNQMSQYLQESIELSGKRVKLLPMQLEHTAGLFEAGQNKEIWRYMPMKMESLRDMTRLVEEALAAKAKGTEYPFVIIDQESNRIVGSTRFLDISVPNRNLEIGWTWHTPEVWRTGVNTESKYLLLQYCFEQLQTVRVQIKADARNQRSLQAIERIGAVKEGTLRHNRYVHDGYLRDSVYFSILAEEWPAVKLRLEGFLS